MRRLTTLLATPAGRAARYLVSLSLLWLLASRIDFVQLAGLRGQFSVPLTVAALLLAGITYPLHAWRWWLLLRAQGIPLSLHWTHVVTWIGQFYNAFLLGGINFITAHDGFCLKDLVSYDVKHNQANGEHNRDGHGHNFSANAGVEGPSHDPQVQQLRGAWRRALLAIARESIARRLIETCAGSPPYLNAFSTRLASARRSRTRSPENSTAATSPTSIRADFSSAANS